METREKQLSIYIEPDNKKIWLSKRTFLLIQDELRILHIDFVPIFCFSMDVKEDVHIAITLLLIFEVAKRERISEVFNVTVRTIHRIGKRYEKGRFAEVLEAVPGGPKGPSKVTEAIEKSILKLKKTLRLSNKEIGRRLCLSEGSIRLVLIKHGVSVENTFSGKQLSLYNGESEKNTDTIKRQENLSADENKDENSIEGKDDSSHSNKAKEDISEAHVEASVPLPAKEQAEDKNEIEESQESLEVSGITFDMDPRDRRIDRSLASRGLIDEAIPFFAEGKGFRYLGVLLIVPFLVSSGVIGQVYKVVGRLSAGFYGLRASILTLIFLFCLRIKHPEKIKDYKPAELGMLLGLDRAPEVKTLRRKLTEIASRRKSAEFITEQARSVVEQDTELIGFLYIDGHVRAYHGNKKIGKGWVATRRLVMPATIDYWVNDINGSPLFFVTTEGNEALTTMLKTLRISLLEICGNRRITFVFDRGGWSPKLFKELFLGGIDVITYRKGASEKVGDKGWLRQIYEYNGKKYEYRLFEEIYTFEGMQFRQILKRRDDGGQTAIITTRWDLPMEKIAFLMFNRWRQENFFKYMKENYGLDALIDYGSEEDDSSREVLNPERKKLSKERKHVRNLLKRYYAQLAEIDLKTPEKSVAKREELLLEINRLESANKGVFKQIQESPKSVSLGKLSSEKPIRLYREKKRFIDSLRMITYRLESALVAEIYPYYSRSEDEARNLVESMFQLSGDLRIRQDKLEVVLESMSSAHRTKVLEKLCSIINEKNIYYPGSKLILQFSVRDDPNRTSE